MKNDELKELIGAQFTAVRAEMKADREITHQHLKAIVEHNERQNGWLKNHTGAIENLQDHARACKSQRGHIRMIVKRWYLVVAGVAAISLLVSMSYHHVNFKQTFTNKTGVEFKDSIQ